MKSQENVTIVSLIFFAFELYFIKKGIKGVDAYKGKTLQKRKNEAFFHAILEPWKTRFYWAGIVQLLFVALIIYLQVKG